MNRWLLGIVGVFALLPFSMNAQWDECNYPEYMCCEESNPCCCPEYNYAINPPIVAGTECGKFYVEGTWLLWRAHCDNLTPGWLNSFSREVDANSFSSRGKSDERRFSYNWDSGFRVGVGFQLPCDQWGVRANYTYFCTTANDYVNVTNATLGDDFVGSEVWFTPFTFQFQNNFFEDLVTTEFFVNSCWKAELHQVDLEFTREYLVGCYLSLRPILGLRFFCLDQKMNVRNDALLADLNSLDTPEGSFSFFAHNKNRYHGGGIRAGLFSAYEIGCGFGIFGDATISVVYGEFQTKEITTASGIDGSATIEIEAAIDTEANCCFCSIKPVFDYGIGLYWRKGFNCDKSLFEVKAGWEHHVYFAQNQFRGQALLGESSFGAPPSGITMVRGGDVTFGGLAVTASILF